MSTLTLATICAGLVFLGLIAYAILGGADFGGGVWDLLASGPSAARQRTAIADAIGPVWEANNVWLIYVIVVTFTAFPPVYAVVSTALFIPIILALLGIVLRGAAFGFRSHYGRERGLGSAWGSVFSVASTITPFLLGMIAGAIAGGDVRVKDGQVVADYWTTWTTPFAFACGAFALALCTVIAATYLSVESLDKGDRFLANTFRARAIVAGAITALLGAVAALLARAESPVLWVGLVGRALPLSLGAVLIGLGCAAALIFNRYRWARGLVAAETACILAAWGVAQYPYLVVPDLRLDDPNTVSPPNVLALVIIGSLAGMVILLPSLWFLFRVFKAPRAPHPRVTAAAFATSLKPADTTDVPTSSRAAASAAAERPSPAATAPATAPTAANRQTLLLLPLAALLSAGVWGRLRDAYDRWRIRSRSR